MLRKTAVAVICAAGAVGAFNIAAGITDHSDGNLIIGACALGVALTLAFLLKDWGRRP